MVYIYKDGEYFVTAQREEDAKALLDLFDEYNADVTRFEIRAAP